MSKSWIRTILLMALAVLCLVGTIAMKACSPGDVVDAPHTEADNSAAAGGDVGTGSDVVDESSAEKINEIKVLFGNEADASASASAESQGESAATEQASSAEEEVSAAPVCAAASESAAPQPTREPTAAAPSVPAPEATTAPVPAPSPEPAAEPAPVPPAPETMPEQNTGYADNGWQPEAAQHYHGNGTDAGTCPACGLIYGPAGGAEGQYGEQDGLMD